jgi:hypothetical protein
MSQLGQIILVTFCRLWCEDPQPGKLFKDRHFERDIIVLCVRWYLRYKSSYQDLVEMMAELGLAVIHTTIMR